MPNYRILHTQVGGWPRRIDSDPLSVSDPAHGRVVSGEEMEEMGAQIKRLIKLGAIVETTDPVTDEEAPAGPLTDPKFVEAQKEAVIENPPPDPAEPNIPPAKSTATPIVASAAKTPATTVKNPLAPK